MVHRKGHKGDTHSEYVQLKGMYSGLYRLTSGIKRKGKAEKGAKKKR